MGDAFSELLIEVLPDWEEAAAAVLWDAGASGVEVRDADTYELTGDFARTEGALVVLGYFAPREALRQLSFVIERLGEDQIHRLEAREGGEVDWVARFRDHFRPVNIGENVLVLPAWIKPSLEELKDKVVVRIDPGPAFGTGQHPTTVLCAEYLETLAVRGQLQGKLLDVGAGTGILGMIAVKLGMESALGVEVEQTARVWARRNIALNNLSRKVLITHKSLGALRGTYQMVMANIRTSVLLDLLPQLKAHMAPAPQGKLIMSGILDVEEQTILDACKQHKLRLFERRQQAEWVALMLGA